MIFEDAFGGVIRSAPPRRLERKLSMAVNLGRTAYVRMGEEATALGLTRQALAERLLNAAWAARCGQCDDPELEAAVRVALKKVRSSVKSHDSQP
jgi:hypothetical protein